MNSPYFSAVRLIMAIPNKITELQSRGRHVTSESSRDGFSMRVIAASPYILILHEPLFTTPQKHQLVNSEPFSTGAPPFSELVSTSVVSATLNTSFDPLTAPVATSAILHPVSCRHPTHLETNTHPAAIPPNHPPTPPPDAA